MKNNCLFYVAFSFLLFLAGASYFPILEYFSINLDRVLMLIQTLISILTMLIAWTALNSWRAQDKYNNLKEMALIFFEFREIARGIKPIDDGVEKALKNIKDDLSVYIEPLYRARLALFSSILKYEKCLLKEIGGNAPKLEFYSPYNINKKFNIYINMLECCIACGFKLNYDEESDGESEVVDYDELVDYLDSGILVVKSLLK